MCQPLSLASSSGVGSCSGASWVWWTTVWTIWKIWSRGMRFFNILNLFRMMFSSCACCGVVYWCCSPCRVWMICSAFNPFWAASMVACMNSVRLF